MRRLSHVIPPLVVTLLLSGLGPAAADSWHQMQLTEVRADKAVDLPDSLRLELPVAKDIRYGQALVLLGASGLGRASFDVVLEHDQGKGGTEVLPLSDSNDHPDFFRGWVQGPDGETVLRRYTKGDFLVATLSFKRGFRLDRGGALAMELYLTDLKNAEGFEPPAARISTDPRAKWWMYSRTELNHLVGQHRPTKHPRTLTGSLLVPEAFGPSQVCFHYGSGLRGNHGKVKRIKTSVVVVRADGSRSRYRTKIEPRTSVPSRPTVRWCLEDFPDLARGDRLVWTHKFLGRKGKIDNQIFNVALFAPASAL